MNLRSENNDKLPTGIKLPPAPYIVTKLQAELLKEEPLLSDIAGILAQDVAISAMVLKTVNSAYFDLRAKVSSIQQAVSLLGINNISNIVSGLALRQAFETADSANPPHFWDSPANTAMAAAKIAKEIGGASPDEAYLLGLFHNAGHALMMQKFPDYPEFFEQNINHSDALITQLEEQIYNTNHATLGYYLARSWQINPALCSLILDHHNTEERLAENDGQVSHEGTLLAVLKMAEHIDKLFWSINPDHEWEQIKGTVLAYIGMSEPDFDDLKDDVTERLMTG